MIIVDPIVLLVDDSETDALLMRTVFERAGFVLPLQFAHDGVEAIAYLRGDGPYCDRIKFPLPTVMLLDLNMPRKDGFEVLVWIREQPALKRLRVYVLTASNRPEDIRRAYDLGANSYLVKPTNLDGLTQMAKILVAWLRRSHFPSIAVTEQDRLATSVPIPAATGDAIPPPAFAQAPALNPAASMPATGPAQQSEIERFTRMVAHDLRTPLMTIGGYTDLLTDRCASKLDDAGRQYLQKITASIAQLENIIASLSERARKTAIPFPAPDQVTDQEMKSG